LERREELEDVIRDLEGQLSDLNEAELEARAVEQEAQVSEIEPTQADRQRLRELSREAAVFQRARLEARDAGQWARMRLARQDRDEAVAAREQLQDQIAEADRRRDEMLAQMLELRLQRARRELRQLNAGGGPEEAARQRVAQEEYRYWAARSEGSPQIWTA
jgi:chromosome segregation ATPase